MIYFANIHLEPFQFAHHLLFYPFPSKQFPPNLREEQIPPYKTKLIMYEYYMKYKKCENCKIGMNHTV